MQNCIEFQEEYFGVIIVSKKKRSIIQLDQKTINKIAAGEVIERPASVVKELIENSIDALATEISIFIEGYGLDLIRIVDNGIGMNPQDAALAWKSHTTSKLKAVEDLDSITSLGFRGEALASIASVSMMELITREKNAPTGTIVRVKGGTLELCEERECSIGTTIAIRNLFYNVPARKKFLKTPTTELGHIMEIANRQALIHPEIHFKLQHNKATLLNSPRSSNPLEPFISIFGVDFAKQMLPVNFEKDGIQITGFTSSPSLSRASRDHEILYVNKRYIRSKIIFEAIEEAYKTLLMKHRYPVALLNIDIESSKVDVNIHPTKREVRFGESRTIYDIVKEAITHTLENNELWRESKGLLQSSSSVPVSTQTRLDGTVKDTAIATSNEKSPVKLKPISSVDTNLIIDGNSSILSTESTLGISPTAVAISDDFWLRPLGQAHLLYILCESNEGIAVVDLHATHERIMYEHLLELYRSANFVTQELLQPITFNLSTEERLFLEENIPHLEKVGFNLEHFGGNTFIIRRLPVIMDLIQTTEDIKNLFDEMRKDIATIPDINERLDLILKTMACHSAVRGGDSVSIEKTIAILEQLSTCNQPFTCPHGRPTIIRITEKDLEKEFGRIV